MTNYHEICICGHLRDEHYAFGQDDCGLCYCSNFEFTDLVKVDEKRRGSDGS